MIPHPGLPSKGGARADDSLIKRVNEQIVQFLFTDQEIEEQGLMDRVVCTIERHSPGSVVTPLRSRKEHESGSEVD